jgi:hypothetical protein
VWSRYYINTVSQQAFDIAPLTALSLVPDLKAFYSKSFFSEGRPKGCRAESAVKKQVIQSITAKESRTKAALNISHDFKPC